MSVSSSSMLVCMSVSRFRVCCICYPWVLCSGVLSLWSDSKRAKVKSLSYSNTTDVKARGLIVAALAADTDVDIPRTD